MWPSSALPVADKMPIRARKTVVLPAPLRPMRAHISPSPRSNVASRMTGTRPIETPRPATLSMDRAPLQTRLGLGAADECLNLRIGKHGRGRSVGDHRTVVEGEHAVGEARHDFHVV